MCTLERLGGASKILGKSLDAPAGEELEWVLWIGDFRDGRLVMPRCTQRRRMPAWFPAIRQLYG